MNTVEVNVIKTDPSKFPYVECRLHHKKTSKMPVNPMQNMLNGCHIENLGEICKTLGVLPPPLGRKNTLTHIT